MKPRASSTPPVSGALRASWTVFQEETTRPCGAVLSRSLGCLLSLCVLDRTPPFRRGAGSSLSGARPLRAPSSGVSTAPRRGSRLSLCVCRRSQAAQTEGALHAVGQCLDLAHGWPGSRMGAPAEGNPIPPKHKRDGPSIWPSPSWARTLQIQLRVHESIAVTLCDDNESRNNPMPGTRK